MSEKILWRIPVWEERQGEVIVEAESKEAAAQVFWDSNFRSSEIDWYNVDRSIDPYSVEAVYGGR